MNEPVQLNTCNWYLEEEKKTEAALNHMRNVLGAYEADKNITYHYLLGYVVGLKAMYRKIEETRFYKDAADADKRL